jgi:hypothetical protein
MKDTEKKELREWEEFALRVKESVQSDDGCDQPGNYSNDNGGECDPVLEELPYIASGKSFCPSSFGDGNAMPVDDHHFLGLEKFHHRPKVDRGFGHVKPLVADVVFAVKKFKRNIISVTGIVSTAINKFFNRHMFIF